MNSKEIEANISVLHGRLMGLSIAVAVLMRGRPELKKELEAVATPLADLSLSMPVPDAAIQECKAMLLQIAAGPEGPLMNPGGGQAA